MAFSCPNYTQTPNDFFDEIAKTLKEGELRILLCIMRQTFGWRKKWDRISLSQLMEKTGMERKAVHNSLKSLIEKRLVQKQKSGKIGQENCWYTLEVDPIENEPEMPDSEADFIDNSNNSYQYPKDTPPSILRIPTKETLTKEKREKIKKKDEHSADASVLSSLLFSKIKERKPNFTKDSKSIGASWNKFSDKLLKLRTLPELEKIIDFAVKDPFWISKCLSPEKLLKHIDALELELLKAADSKRASPAAKTLEDKKLAENVVKKYPHNPDILVGDNYIEFDFGPMNRPHIKFGENGFKEQVLNNLRKIGLSSEGL